MMCFFCVFLCVFLLLLLFLIERGSDVCVCVGGGGGVAIIVLYRYLLLFYAHGKQLRLCRDSQFLNHTVTWQEFTSIQCTFFRQ